MGRDLDPQRCAPTEDVPQLVAVFREMARAREQRMEMLAGAAAGAAAGLPLVPIALAPAGATKAEQYAHYERILASRGIALDPAQPTVLALRGLDTAGKGHEATSTARYDDTMVVLQRDAQGNPQVTTLAGSTHPGQKTADIGGAVGVPDVDKNGAADVGMLNPGEYVLVRRGDHNGAQAWDVRTVDGAGAVPGVRDLDQDGKFTDVERGVSSAAWFTMTGVMIHQGADTFPRSAGCLNLSSQDAVYPEFVKAVGDDTQRGKLVVLDASAK